MSTLRTVFTGCHMTGNVYVAGTLRSSQYVLLDEFGEDYIVQYLSRVTGLEILSF